METIISEIRTLISKGKLERAFKKLDTLNKNDLDDLNDTIFLLRSRLSTLENQEMMSIISSENARLERNKITLAVLDVVEQLEDLKLTPSGQEEDIRKPVSPIKTPTTSSTNTRKILFLASNPKDTGQLRLGQELRDIEEGLKRSQYRDQFELESRFAVRTSDLSRAMLDERPNIIHFSGHGVLTNGVLATAEGTRALEWEEDEDENTLAGYGGGIALEDLLGNTKVVKAEALAGMFELFSDKIECVVLNACYSSAQADALIKHIPYVIGMNAAVPDATAIAFATGFYDSLGAGESIEFSFKFAKSQIPLNNLHGGGIPVIRKRDG